MITCKTCGELLEYSGRGRRPVYCKPHAKTADNAKRVARRKRAAAHMRGETYGRWGDLWLVDGRPVKRKISPSYPAPDGKPYLINQKGLLDSVVRNFDDPRQVSDGNLRAATYTDLALTWGTQETDAPGNELVVTSTSGVLGALGASGAPVGTSTTREDLSARLRASQRQAEAHTWHKENRDWWKIEEFANTAMSFDVRERAETHGTGPQKAFTQEELDDYADLIDNLSAGEYRALQDQVINRQRALNGLGPKEKIMTGRPLTSLKQDEYKLNGLENIYGPKLWTEVQMINLVVLRRRGLTFAQIEKRFPATVGNRSARALARKYNRLTAAGRTKELLNEFDAFGKD